MFTKRPSLSPNPVIVWIHGTKASSVFPLLAKNNPLKKIFDSVTRTSKGLLPMSELNQEGRTYQLLKTLSDAAPEHFPWETTYSFGWSGKLGTQARKSAAQELYNALVSLTIAYKKRHGAPPPIILISHSHGGNLILNIAGLYNQDHELNIQKTILLACPVQQETAYFVDNTLFGTVYSLHSHVDVLQIMDPQRLHPYKHAFEQWQETRSFTPLKEAYILGKAQPLFSERHFPACNHLIQGNICWKTAIPWKRKGEKPSNKLESLMHQIVSPLINQKRGVLHSEFISPGFMKHLPSIIMQIDDLRAKGSISTPDIEILI